MNPGPPALDASTIPPGYRGGGPGVMKHDAHFTQLNRLLVLSNVQKCMFNLQGLEYKWHYSPISLRLSKTGTTQTAGARNKGGNFIGQLVISVVPHLQDWNCLEMLKKMLKHYNHVQITDAIKSSIFNFKLLVQTCRLDSRFQFV